MDSVRTTKRREDGSMIRNANDDGEGYDFEGRFGVHVSERDLAWHVASYQPAADRRERLGRVRCPFAIPRDHEALRFDL